MGGFTPYENFSILIINHLQIHPPLWQQAYFRSIGENDNGESADDDVVVATVGMVAMAMARARTAVASAMRGRGEDRHFCGGSAPE